MAHFPLPDLESDPQEFLSVREEEPAGGLPTWLGGPAGGFSALTETLFLYLFSTLYWMPASASATRAWVTRQALLPEAHSPLGRMCAKQHS